MQDINRLAYLMVADERSKNSNLDPFWERTAEILLISLIALMVERGITDHKNIAGILDLIDRADATGDDDAMLESDLDRIFMSWEKTHPGAYSVKTYKKYRTAASRTLKSILISLNSHLAVLGSPEILVMTEDDTIDIASLGIRKRAIFVVVSDTDRSLDTLVNIFFTQAMQVLCKMADTKYKRTGLPVPVRFRVEFYSKKCRGYGKGR